MTLSCRFTNEALHNQGHQVVGALLTGGEAISGYKPAKGSSEIPVIPAPEIFQQETRITEKDPGARLPTVSECAIHLELLEVFFVLRERILRSAEIDKSMGISLKRETKTGHKGDKKTLKDDTFETRRKTKWPKYVEFAVARFLDWRCELAKMTRPGDIASFHYPLPSLDVLMVWHSFLLNPLLFNKHCRNELIYDLPFPWQRIHECINNSDWSFQLPADDTTQTTPLFDVLSTWESHIPFESSNPPPTPLPSFFSPAAKKPAAPSLLLPAFTLTSAPALSLTSSLPTAISRHASLFKTIATTPPLRTLGEALHAAVLRQTSFIDKMNSHLWIRSPSLESTLTRAISRYSSFLLLMRRNKGKMLVPTVDIDLVWHTHQCSGGRNYATGVKERVGRFVNHDDDLAQGVLTDGAADTRKLWRLQVGGEYKRCGCWDCEGMLEEVERAVKEGKGEVEVDMDAVVKRVEERVRYYRAVEAARRKRRPLPARPEGL
ncbi:hypothetical protein QBC34DRAFT_415016 [Podospora aff. communis PSN243]|uniref:Uncharacterized protein n=1 Tax=Podospora aff. communis PSN243 TaxID=3040156 RepID=A0AAV9GB11_9PEZI|nr:hypothetical protein QBC34DRAFT_415016 [Podospora aff. communis PSN243]